jgi:hypothetical protein
MKANNHYSALIGEGFLIVFQAFSHDRLKINHRRVNDSLGWSTRHGQSATVVTILGNR